MSPVLELREVDASYGPFRALFGVSLTVEAGGSVALLGSNGAGKTTVARVASGLVTPTSGSVLVDGEDLTGARPHQYARAGVAHAPEGRSVFATLTVAENLRLSFHRSHAAAEVARSCRTFEQWAADVLPEPSQPITNDETVLHHGHCHQKALIGTGPALEAIRRGGGCSKDLDSGCCGMAGSFGYEPEHLGVSLAIGERVLAPAVRDHRAPVVAPGISCRRQGAHLTSVRAISTAERLADGLDDHGP